MFETMTLRLITGPNATAKNLRSLKRTARSRIKELIKEGKVDLVRQLHGEAWAEMLALDKLQSRYSFGQAIQYQRMHVAKHGGDEKVAQDCGGACIYDR